MSELLITFGVFLLVTMGMAIGWIVKRKPISGSCGGLNTLYQENDGSCQICGAQVDESCRRELMEKLNS